jgi:2,3-bisphosphoglycerate-dependent phosphoglycerate mutase
MPKIVLLRHGQSAWNLTNKFAGWVDVDLSPRGLQEARDAGEVLRATGYSFDLAYTSALRRAQKSLDALLDQMELLWIPVEKTWRLNERHNGALQGLDKTEVMERFGAVQYKLWRRSYDVPPPPLAADSPFQSARDPRYSLLPPSWIPWAECLKDCVDRILPYWSVEIVPQILAGKRILIVAHGSTLRALLKHLKNISDEAIIDVNVPNGVPLVVELDDRLRYVSDSYLGDPKVVEAKITAVANQGKKQP